MNNNIENPMVSGEGFTEVEPKIIGKDSCSGEELLDIYEWCEFDSLAEGTFKFASKENMIKWLIENDYVIIHDGED